MVLKEILGKNGVEISFVIESGNKNDANLIRIFDFIREKYQLHDKLRSIIFSPKDSSRALQLADFFALYSRTHVEAAERNNGIPPANDFITSRLIEGVHLIDIVATDFFVQDPSRAPGASSGPVVALF